MDMTADEIVSQGKGGKSPQRGVVSVPVEEKIFSSEVKRLDAEISNVKKSQDKFDTKVEKAIDDLRQDVRELRQEMRGLRQDVHNQIDRLDARLWWLMGAVIVSILMPIALKFLFP